MRAPTSSPPPTPLIPIRADPAHPPLYCKLEYLNPSGSTKDRVARNIRVHALEEGLIELGGSVIEASSGSTSIAMAMVCAELGLSFTAIMPEGASTERELIIRAYGGAVVYSPRGEGMAGALELARKTAARADAFLPAQFENPLNVQAHTCGTARDILDELVAGASAAILAVVSGVGTGGTLVGLYEGLKGHAEKVIPVAAIPVSAGAAASCLGPSSGLNYAAGLAALATGKIPAEAVVITVFPDRMERYFSTELFAPVKGNS